MKRSRIALLAAFIFLLLPSSTRYACAQIWVSNSVPDLIWNSVASSADGRTLIAVAGGDPICVSTNSGNLWTPTITPIADWQNVAVSADGSHVVAVAQNIFTPSLPAGIWLSTNTGATWTKASAPAGSWTTTASSADGARLYAGNYSDGSLYISADSGATWSPASAPAKAGYAIACSADGSRVVVGAGGGVVTSANSGANWTYAQLDANGVLNGVACTADGSKMTASCSGNIFTSTNSGATWTFTSILEDHYPTPMTCSGDGRLLVEAGFYGWISFSYDWGKSWLVQTDIRRNWFSLANSADGSKLVAALKPYVYGEIGMIYTWRSIPSLSLEPFGDQIKVGWSVSSSAADFTLQHNSDLTTTNWLDVTNSPVIISNRNEVVLPASDASAFFRLKLQ